MTTLVISRFLDGTETVVGTLRFGGADQAQLTATGPEPERERLETAWNEVAARESIPMDVTERTEFDGRMIMEFNTRLVDRHDPEYADAVCRFLETEYGYLVDRQG